MAGDGRLSELATAVEAASPKQRAKAARAWLGRLPANEQAPFQELIERALPALEAGGAAALIGYARLPSASPLVQRSAQSSSDRARLEYVAGALAVRAPAPKQVLLGHKGSPTAFAQHPDGRWLTGGGHDDASLRMWSPDGKLLLEIETPHHGGVRSIAIDVARNLSICSGTDGDGSLSVYDLATGTLIRRHELPEASFALLAFDAEARLLIVADGGLHAIAVDRDDWTPIWSIIEPGQRSGAYSAFVLDSPAREVLALRVQDQAEGWLEERELATGALRGKRSLEYDFAAFRGFVDGALTACEPDRLMFVPQLAKAGTCVWQRSSGHALAQLAPQAGVTAGNIVNDGAAEVVVLGTNRGSLQATQISDGSLIAEWPAHSGAISLLERLDGGRTILSAGADGALRLWDTATVLAGGASTAAATDAKAIEATSAKALERAELFASTPRGDILRFRSGEGLTQLSRGPAFFPGRMAVAADRPWLAMIARAEYNSPPVVRVFDRRNGSDVHSFSQTLDVASDLAFLRDGNLVVVEPGKLEGQIFSVPNRTAQRFRASEGHGPLTRVFASPTAESFVALHAMRGAEAAAELFDETGQSRFILSGHHGEIHDVAFSADGQRVFTSATDATVRVYSAATGECERVFGTARTPFKSFAYVPAARIALAQSLGLLVATGEKKELRVFDVESGAELGPLSGHAKPPTLVVAPRHGDWAASAGPDGSLRIWDLKASTQRAAFWFAGTIERLKLVDDSTVALVSSGPQLHVFAVG